MANVTKARGAQWIEWILVFSLVVGICGCVELLVTGQPARTGAEQPDEAFVSPDLKFEEISSVAIFPFLPVRDENDQWADLLNDSFAGEVQSRQENACRVHVHRQLLDYISQSGLGQGYKQLQADHNSSPMGLLVLTPSTVQFFRTLHQKHGVDAFLIGSYQIGTRVEQRVNCSTGQIDFTRIPEYTVRVALYSVKANEVWWRAKITRAGNMNQVARVVSASLAANIGKGRLRNL